jgi:hypothetical protein
VKSLVAITTVLCADGDETAAIAMKRLRATVV